uniref:Phosphatidic acid phosphatase type 2/haloperoxidase domain-containing protein n=1 Tax=Monopterus albus TaxID=43700 RepID=A0A3Q3JZ24_MONAL
MLYFQVMILTATVTLVYYYEFTDTFSPAQQGFVCRDPAHKHKQPEPMFILTNIQTVSTHIHRRYEVEANIVVMGDCCYVNPMVRRTIRFLGNLNTVHLLKPESAVCNTVQVNVLAPYFLSVCRPNYMALNCQDTAHFVTQTDACAGDPDDIIRARKTFPSKEAALSLYAACVQTMYIVSCVSLTGGRLTGPLLSLSLVSLAVLTGINRVSEYRNHWSDLIAGQAVGGAGAVFLVSCYLISSGGTMHSSSVNHGRHFSFVIVVGVCVVAVVIIIEPLFDHHHGAFT